MDDNRQNQFERKLHEAEVLRNSDPDRCIQMYQELVGEAEASDNTDHAFRSYCQLGNTYVTVARFKDAMEMYQRAEDVLPEPKSPELMGDVLNGRAIIHSHGGEFGKAVELYETALTLADEAGNRRNKCVILVNLGNIYAKQELFNQGISLLKEALPIIVELHDKKLLTVCHVNLGTSYGKIGQAEQALLHLKAAYNCAIENDLSYYLPPVQSARGELLIKQGEIQMGYDCLSQAVRIASELQDKVELINALLVRHQYGSREQRYDPEEDLQTAITIADEIESPDLQRDAYKQAWKYYKSNGEFEKALVAHEKYLRYYQAIVDKTSRNRLMALEFQTLQENRNRMTVISSIGRELTAELDLDKVLNQVYQQLNDIFDATTFGIARYIPDQEAISYDLFIDEGQRKDLGSRSVHDTDSLAGWVIRHRKNMVIQDSSRDLVKYGIHQNIPDPPDPENRRPLSVLYSPLVVMDQVIGVMTVQSYRKQAYRLADIDTFHTLASYAAVALKNAYQAQIINQKNAALQTMSQTDELTGVYNRRYFLTEFEKMWEWGNRSGSGLGILMIDVDLFKKINDNFGHPGGDACLIHLADLFRSSLSRRNDIVARYGGEEFVVLLGTTNASGASKVAERIRRTIEATPAVFKGNQIKMTVSIGMRTVNPEDFSKTTPDLVLTDADNALYQAKKSGRNRVISNLEPVSG